jgi:hypothetical protein
MVGVWKEVFAGHSVNPASTLFVQGPFHREMLYYLIKIAFRVLEIS